MGYTHYWNIPSAFPITTFNAILADATKLLAEARKQGIVICGGLGKGEPDFNDRRIWFNGTEEGDLDHETFLLERKLDKRYSYIKPERGLYFQFCKTAMKPYDLLVGAILCSLKAHCPECRIGSDGDEEDWRDILAFYNETLGRNVTFSEVVGKD